jgi:hypothetical protein
MVRVPGYRSEMYCASCDLRNEFICYVQGSRPPLWSSGQSSWLQIQRSGFDYRRYQIFWLVGLEWNLLSLVNTTEELLGRKSSCSGLEIREYSRRDLSRWPRGTLYPQKLELTSWCVPPTQVFINSLFVRNEINVSEIGADYHTCNRAYKLMLFHPIAAVRAITLQPFQTWI